MLFGEARPFLGKAQSSARTGKGKESFAPRILIVEPNLDDADHLSDVLTEAGYQVVIAGDGRTSLAFIGDTSPDLILINTKLPDMTGYELTEILRAAGQYAWRLRHVNIIYMTPRDKVVKHRLVGAPEANLNSYLFKPVRKAEILARVKAALRVHPRDMAMQYEESQRKKKKFTRKPNIFADLSAERIRRASYGA